MSKKLLLKIASAVLAVIVLVTGVIVIINNVGTTEISLGTNKVMPGDTFEIPLKIDKNHGIWAAQIYIKYDADNLTFVSQKNGDVFDGCFANDDNGVVSLILKMNADKESTKDGLLTTLNFKAKISADDGDYDLKFSDDCMFINYDAEIIDVKYIDGKISVK